MSQSSIHVYILIRVWWCKSVLINCVGRCLMPIESNVAPSPAEFFFSGASAALSGGHTSHRSRPSFGIASWQLSEKKAPGWGFFGGILHNLVMWIPISLKKNDIRIPSLNHQDDWWNFHKSPHETMAVALRFGSYLDMVLQWKKMLTGRIPGIPGILLMDEILGGAGFCPSTVPLGCIPDFFLNSGECVQDQ